MKDIPRLSLSASMPAMRQLSVCGILMHLPHPLITLPMHPFGLCWKIVTYGRAPAEPFTDFLGFHE